MVWTISDGIRKSLQAKILNFSAVFILTVSVFSAGMALFLVQNVFASGITNAYVSPSGTSGADCSAATPCDNFSDAVNAVSAGGTIHVANGTYTETFDIDKSGVTVISDHGRNHVTINGMATVKADGVTINGFTFTNPSGTGGVVVHNSDSAAIENDAFTNVGTSYSGSNAVQAVYIEGSSSNANVAHNNFSSVGSSANTSSNKAIFIGDSTAGTTDNISIFDNNIDGVTGNPNPWGSGGHGAYGILVNHKVTGLQVSSNNIKNLDGLWAHAIGLENDTPSATVTNNIVKNLTDHKGGIDSVAVQLESNPGAPSITLTGNKLDGHLLTLAKSYIPVDVAWDPLSSFPSANTYPEVLFHGTYYFYGINAFSDINSGMSAVDGSGTVEVESGNYPNVNATGTYNDNITVEGWHNTKPTVNGLHLTGATFNGLTFKGFTFVGDSTGYGNDSVNIDGGGTYASLAFQSNTFDGQGNPGRSAVFINRGFDGLTFQNNMFTGYDGSSPGTVYSIVFAEAQDSTWGNHYNASNNKLRHSNAVNFFEAYRWKNVSYTQNNVSADQGRLLVWSDDQRGPLESLGTVDINNNTVNVHEGTGIGVYNAQDTSLNVNNNNVKGAESCLKLDSVSDSSVTGNTFNHCSTRGVLFSKDYPTAPNTASISGNTFQHGPVGVENAVSGYYLDACDNTFADITTPLYSHPGPFNKVKCEVPSAVLTANSNGHNIPNGGATNSEYFTFNLSGAPDADHYQLKYWNNISGSAFNGESHAWSPSNINNYSTDPHQLGVYVDHFTQGEGTHYFKFSACDAHGDCSDYSAPFQVIYDKTRPTVSFVTPTTFSNPFNTGPVVKINASDALSGLSTMVIHVYNSSNTLLSTCGSANSSELAAGSMSCDLSSLPDGTYSIKAGAFDKAGNNQTISSGSFIIDRTPPAKVTGMTVKVNGTSVGCGAVINQRDITVDWNDSTDPNFDHYQYQADADETAPYDFTTNVNSSQRSGSIRDQDGTYHYRVRAIDSAGNIGEWSDWCGVTLDRQAPVVSFTNPANSSMVKGTVDIRGTVADSNPDHYYLKITQDSNGSVKYSHTYYGAPQAFTDHSIYSWNTKAVADGAYTIDLEARDAAGNKDSGSVKTISVTVNNDAPDVTINSYNANSNVITPSVTATDPTPGDTLTYSWAANDAASTSNVTVSDPSALEPDFTVNADGSYSFTLTVTDAAGNATAKTFDFTYSTPPVTFSTTLAPSNNQGNSGNNGGGTTGGTFTNVTTGTPGNGGAGGNGGGQVLGASTNTPNTDSENGNGGTVSVKSASDTKDNGKNSSAFLGLGWWWLPVVVILFGLFFALFRRADGTDKAS